MALVELSIVEQRYRAVLEAAAGVPVTEVAARYDVSRQSVHAWIHRYAEGGLGALADRPRRPDTCPHQVSAEIEAAVCEMRREHRRWGPLRLVDELAKAGVSPVPSRMSAYRALVRHGLIQPGARKRRKDSYLRWSGRNQWHCGSWTSWAGRSSLMAPKRKSSPAWMTIPGTA